MTPHPLKSERSVIVYLDFKSPYAYLAVEPTRELERELGVKFDWRPFVLDIPSYLGSASLDESGGLAEQDRSAEQWAGVKYAYYDCRRYASLRNLTIRGTVKIWDTNLVATAMLWAKRFGDDVLDRFIDLVYEPFWKRDLEIDDTKAIQQILDIAGAQGNQFSSWAKSEGLALNEQFQANAFDQGIYGVPTYVVDEQLYFGREYLPLVKWHLMSQQATEAKNKPDIAYTLPMQLSAPVMKPKMIHVGVGDSLDCLLALAPLKTLFDQCDLQVIWVRIKTGESEPLPPAGDNSRGAVHQRLRASNDELNRQRFAPKSALDKGMTASVKLELERLNITLVNDGPADVVQPALPGIAIKIDDDIFIGRQHLPLLRKLLV